MESAPRRESRAPRLAASNSLLVEAALRERLAALTVELAKRDQRIAQQEVTIAALIDQLDGPAAA